MKTLKILLIVSLALGVASLVAYAEHIAGIPADICFIPNLAIGAGLGLYALFQVIDILEA